MSGEAKGQVLSVKCGRHDWFNLKPYFSYVTSLFNEPLYLSSVFGCKIQSSFNSKDIPYITEQQVHGWVSYSHVIIRAQGCH